MKNIKLTEQEIKQYNKTLKQDITIISGVVFLVGGVGVGVTFQSLIPTAISFLVVCCVGTFCYLKGRK